ncbi:interleukin 12 receptor, beta 2a, like [Antennarius striatus]|uniref:interleukin 12 receptor, beta 2a, like n=1 Tax=Antennarius striatus TaxID=241820 RepID=UPI0035B4B86B
MSARLTMRHRNCRCPKSNGPIYAEVASLALFLVILSSGFSPAISGGPPAPPSPPECFIPCDHKSCLVHINCTWEERQEPEIPTIYSLHWEPASSKEGHWINGSTLSRQILREQFSYHGELRVWVQAKNQYGSAKSQEVVFNTANIIKPPPPTITSSHQDSLEIFWNSTCIQLQLSSGLCEVRHRTGVDQAWFEDGEIYGSYSFDNLLPCMTYEVQVGCACGRGLRSDWSEIHSVQGTETAPVGELDVWGDCGIFPETIDCVLTWKRLPVSQACGVILGYEVTLLYKNGTAVLVNVSRVKPRHHLLCDEKICCFTVAFKTGSSASVSAYNAHGATVPSYFVVPFSGKEENHQGLHLRMDEENLTVSWDVPLQHSDNLQKYLVQYKQVGAPAGQTFDWVKVNKSQTTTFFKGQFTKYTPYQVSLFTVSYRGEVHHLLSVIGYSRQRIPSTLPSLKVISIATTHVTFLLEPIPLAKQEGLVLHYQIGIDTQNVRNVSAVPQHENKTFEVQHLSSGQSYVAWIRAVTAAGLGEKASTMFETKHEEYFGKFSILFGVICLFVICLLVFTSICCGESKVIPLLSPCYCDKVPDPRNSHIFREMKHQLNDQITWICIPVYEPHPEISLLEIVEIQPWASKSSVEKFSDADGLNNQLIRDGSSHKDCQNGQREDAVIEEFQWTEDKHGGEAYSKKVDSDEERENEDYCSSSEEEHSTGYEKHFMPTVSDVWKVS